MNDHPKLPESGFLTRKWVQKRYGISNSTMHAWQAAGVLPKSQKIGPRAVRFRAEDLAKFEAKLLARTDGKAS